MFPLSVIFHLHLSCFDLLFGVQTVETERSCNPAMQRVLGRPLSSTRVSSALLSVTDHLRSVVSGWVNSKESAVSPAHPLHAAEKIMDHGFLIIARSLLTNHSQTLARANYEVNASIDSDAVIVYVKAMMSFAEVRYYWPNHRIQLWKQYFVPRSFFVSHYTSCVSGLNNEQLYSPLAEVIIQYNTIQEYTRKPCCRKETARWALYK